MPTGGKSTIRIAVLTILLVHVALIGGMLIQGCSKDASKNPAEEQSSVPSMGGSNSEPQPAYPAETNASAPMDTNASNAAIPALTTTSSVPPFNPATASNASAQPVTAPSIPAAPAEPASLAPSATGSTTEYSVVSGDKLSSIAKKHGVSLKALEAANPGVDSRKLKVGQKLQIPAPTTGGASTESASAGTASSAIAETTTYTVKQGDVLARIAKTHGTTSKAIMALNHLKSSNIRVGQKLKMPAPKAAAEASAHGTNN